MKQPFLLDLNTFEDARGKLSVLEAEQFSAYSFSHFIFDQDSLMQLQTKALPSSILIIALCENISIKVLDNQFDLTLCSQALYLPAGLRFYLNNQLSNLSCLIVTMNEVVNSLDEFFFNRKRYSNFAAKRFYLIYDVPLRVKRGCHAHVFWSEYFFVLQGKISISLNEKSYILTDISLPAFIDKKIWSEQVYLEKDSIALVVANENYTKEGYISQKPF